MRIDQGTSSNGGLISSTDQPVVWYRASAELARVSLNLRVCKRDGSWCLSYKSQIISSSGEDEVVNGRRKLTERLAL
jgi:hypothetical protein